LNLIDPLNFPAANMRFFEVPAWGGLQVSSACPEMEREFIHGEHIFYYKDKEDLHDLLVNLLKDDDLREKVAKASQTKILAKHTYADRIKSILGQFENGLN
jgi:spore maturation protein CgeB